MPLRRSGTALFTYKRGLSLAIERDDSIKLWGLNEDFCTCRMVGLHGSSPDR